MRSCYFGVGDEGQSVILLIWFAGRTLASGKRIGRARGRRVSGGSNRSRWSGGIARCRGALFKGTVCDVVITIDNGCKVPAWDPLVDASAHVHVVGRKINPDVVAEELINIDDDEKCGSRSSVLDRVGKVHR